MPSQGWSHRHLWVVSVNENAINHFTGWLYYLCQCLLCCSPGKPSDCLHQNEGLQLALPSISITLPSWRSPRRSCPKVCLFLPLNYGLLETTVIMFLLASPSAPLRSPDTPQGLNKRLLLPVSWVWTAGSSPPRLVFNWIPSRGGGRSCAWWFICFASSSKARSAPRWVVRSYHATGSSYCIGYPYSF